MADENENSEEPAQTEEEMLAQWQDMADEEEAIDGDAVAEGVPEGDAPAAEGEAEMVTEGDSPLGERILDQDEIDSLLGVDGGSEDENVGIRALVDTSVVNYERLPMLDVIFDKFERLLATSMRHFTGDNVDITIDSISTVRFSEFLNSVPLPAGIAVVNAVGLDDYILMIYESKLIYGVVDVLLGGRKARPARIEGRNFSSIERRLMENLTDVVLADLSEAFAYIAPIQFTSERLEANPRFANITREGNACILVTMRVNLEEREGFIQFCLPYGTLEPIREQLLQQFMGEKLGQDNVWANHLEKELYPTEVGLSAVLSEEEFSLKDVLKWRIGQTVELHATPSSNVQLKCGKVRKLTGKIGKVDDMKAIRITHNIVDVNNEESEGN